jgi:hypothetical protein
MNNPTNPQFARSVPHGARAIQAGKPAVRSATKATFVRRAQAVAVASSIALMAASGAAHAQTAAPAPAESAMVKLIRGLIASGALAKDVGESLLAQAQTEAMAAQQAQRQAATASAAVGAASGAGTAALASSNALSPQPGDVHVPYIPPAVRDQIRDEVKGEIMAQAKTEGWAAPNEMPEWTKRIHIDGDVRLRDDSRMYSNNNSNIQIDPSAINAGSGYDVNHNSNPVTKPPTVNTLKDRRNQLSIRARLGITADISDSTQAGIRLASGNDNNPVSTTQALGGGLSKDNIWLDQAWMSYKPTDWLKITGGRFGNPFMSTDTLFSNDLNFDGIAVQVNKALPSNPDLSVFGTLGFIPLEYSANNAPSQSLDKTSSQNKWLLGAQVGANWKINTQNRLRGAVAYYDFDNISGQLSQSCALYAGDPGCSTDWSRPAFMQQGNTLMQLRNIALNPIDPADTPQPQYLGLASRFQLLDLNASWDTKVMGDYGLRLDADFIRNLAYSADDMFARAGSDEGIVNNFGGTGGTGRADFRSGGNAYMVQVTFGKPAPVARGDWNVLMGYKRIEPDALPDAYNDPTFHNGGTNARGYYLGGSYAVDKNTWFTGRWFATKEVYGPPVSIDTLQLEFNARF